MKTLRLLLGLRLRSAFSIRGGTKKENGRRKKAKRGGILFGALLLGFLFLLFAFVAFSVLLVVAAALAMTEGADIGFFHTLSCAATFLLCLVGSVAIAKNELYGAKDNDLLLSMPIRPALILVSRTVYLLLCDLYFGLMLILPAAVLHFAFFAAEVGVGGTLFFLLALLLQPLLALALSCFLGWLLSFILPRLPFKKGLSLLAMLAGIGVYFFFCFGFSEILESIELDVRSFADTLSPYLVLFWPIGSATAHGNVGAGVLFLVCTLLLLLLALFFLARTYVSTLTVRRGESKRIYHEKQSRRLGSMTALVRRELSQLLAYPLYIFNEGLGLFLAPVIGILMLIKGRDLLVQLLEDPELGGILAVFLPALPALLAAALCMLGATCILSAPSISLEGSRFAILKALPVSAGDILCAKAYLHILAMLPFFLPTSLMLTISLVGLLPLGFLDVLVIFLLPFAFNCLVAFLGVALNFAFPRFDYPTVAMAVKSGASVLLTMLAAVALAVIVSGAALLSLTHASLVLTLLALLLLGLAAILRAYLRGDAAAKRLAMLG